MELKGTVLNVVDFGAFVDIGLKDSGLVHISQLANRYIKSPHDVVSVGDVVTAWVMGVDHERKRVSLTMVKPGTERRGGPRGGGGGGRRGGGGEREPRGERRPVGAGGPATGRPPRRGGSASRGTECWRQCSRRWRRIAAPAAAQAARTRRRGPGGQRPGGRRPGGPPGRGGPGPGSGPRPLHGGPGRGAERTPPPRPPVRPSKPAPPPPPLSKDALAGSVPLRTFGQLKQLWQARTTDEPGGEPTEKPGEPPAAQSTRPRPHHSPRRRQRPLSRPRLRARGRGGADARGRGLAGFPSDYFRFHVSSKYPETFGPLACESASNTA